MTSLQLCGKGNNWNTKAANIAAPIQGIYIFFTRHTLYMEIWSNVDTVYTLLKYLYLWKNRTTITLSLYMPFLFSPLAFLHLQTLLLILLHFLLQTQIQTHHFPFLSLAPSPFSFSVSIKSHFNNMAFYTLPSFQFY